MELGMGMVSRSRAGGLGRDEIVSYILKRKRFYIVVYTSQRTCTRQLLTGRVLLLLLSWVAREAVLDMVLMLLVYF